MQSPQVFRVPVTATPEATRALPAFERKVGAIKGLFLQNLWRIVDTSVMTTKQAFDVARREDRQRVLSEHLQRLLEDSVSCVKKWFPRLVRLADEFPNKTNQRSSDWANLMTTEILNEYFRFDGRDSPPLSPSTLHWWIRTVYGRPGRELQAPAINLMELAPDGLDMSVIFPLRFQYELVQLTDEATLDTPATLAETPKADQNSQPDPTSAAPSQTEAHEGQRASFVRPRLAEKGWSTHDWAQQSGVDFHTADGYLKGKTNPYESTRKKLADSLDVSVEDLPK